MSVMRMNWTNLINKFDADGLSLGLQNHITTMKV